MTTTTNNIIAHLGTAPHLHTEDAVALTVLTTAAIIMMVIVRLIIQKGRKD